MTANSLTRITPPQPRIALGGLVVAAAGLASLAFGGVHSLDLTGLGRLVVLILLVTLTLKGATWARIVLSVFAILAAIGLIVGAFSAGFLSFWGALFSANAAAYLVGTRLLLTRRAGRT